MFFKQQYVKLLNSTIVRTGTKEKIKIETLFEGFVDSIRKDIIEG